MNHIARPIPAETADLFFAQTESLHAEHIRSTRRQRNAAWWVAGASVAMNVLMATAIAVTAPLHTVEWRLVRVDSATGVVDEVNQLRDAPKTVNEANARFFLSQYVRQREGYAAPEAEYNFRAVSLMSTREEQGRYANDVKGSNPTSPQVVFGRGGFIRVRIESVSVLGPKLGQVRFTREELKDGGNPKVSTWVATIGFDWQPGALISNADRTVNPLGFQVADYHVDAVVTQ
jgi:type IV secretion system protein VirB8